MKRLETKRNGFNLYNAGLPSFPRNFTRDSIISAILMNNADMLKNQLCFCALKQGVKKDSYTGEEPGKIFHEYPIYEMNGLSTEFNACDTTALYLIGHEVYQKLTGDTILANNQKANIEKAVEYILAHLKNGLFVESPEFCDAENFALKITYWKDSEILDRKNKKPVYPVIYVLAHIQNMRGLRSAAKLLNSEKLNKVADKMSKNLQKLFDSDLGVFYIAIDKQGPIRGISSDSIHSLFYLEHEDLKNKQLQSIAKSVEALETIAGYRTTNIKGSRYGDYDYSLQVWPFEQAIINIGARKFNFDRIADVSSRVMQWLDTAPEIIILDNENCPSKVSQKNALCQNIKKYGCDPQLWTIAAKKYFK